ncbi:hypothetical protein BU24DRAFT_467187 [Aaosphaeria arxii CBS 175.79]|uniref:Cyanovirin-N domain-containing protein n=1 Tax=Aaosphaeria arxii CBS 175.79 TaxID=1450172 RepID=A0A6A5XCF0_9PLEO|nr:uncharacterized protein BU24DRAFT_467187 [Aaosphaeria arxii CBS 175.79]KAF2010571.1 hypothetical protein BU24DRAFT_467187 [Aaosphaeria arxii CBS 175.79]
MKTSFAILTFALASFSLAAPSERRQSQTSFTICKEKKCEGDINQRKTIDVIHGQCQNFPEGWNNTARATIANGGDSCFLHDGNCGSEGATIPVGLREDDLEQRGFDRIASSVTCVRSAKLKRQVDTTVLLCKEKRCAGPASSQISVDLAFERCYNFTPAFDNQVIAVKANSNAVCFLHEGPCDDPRLGVRFEGQVDDLTQNIIGTTSSSITCYDKNVINPPQ